MVEGLADAGPVVTRLASDEGASGRAGGRAGGALAVCALPPGGAVAARGVVGFTAGGGSLARARRGVARGLFTGGGAGGGSRPSRNRMLLSMEAVRASLTIWASAFSFVFSAS